MHDPYDLFCERDALDTELEQRGPPFLVCMEASINIGDLNTCVDCALLRTTAALNKDGLPLCSDCARPLPQHTPRDLRDALALVEEEA